jgi:hypothetical protein
MIHIERANASDAEYIGHHLRPEDADEIRVVVAQPWKAVVAGAKESRRCFTVRHTAHALHPCIIYGVATDPSDSKAGIVWLVATPRVKQVSLSFLKAAPEILLELVRGYTHLHNYVDNRNELHLKWLQHLGFTFDSQKIVSGYPFTHAMWCPPVGGI